MLCVGTGGLGSPLALYLAAAGVGTLGLVDFDVVDYTNLQRQVLHYTSDVGRLKLDSAIDKLTAINPFVRIERFDTYLNSQNALSIFDGFDIIADGTDNFATRYLVNDACVLSGKPNVYASIFRFEGQASIFGAKDGPCYRCLYPEPPPPGLVPSCAEGGVLGVLPGLLGIIQATEVIKLILGVGESLVGRLVLVARDIGDAHAIQVIDRRAQTDRISDVVCTGFKALRRRLIERLLEGNVLDHVAYTLPWRHVVQHLGPPIQHADSGWGKDLVSGEDVEVAANRLHIHAHVRNCLRASDQHACAVTMRGLNHLLHRQDRAQRVGDMSDRDQPRFWSQQLLVLIEQHLAGVVHRSNAQACTLFRAEHLPGNYIGVMLHPGDDNLVVLLNVAASLALRHQIDGLGGSTHKNDLARRSSIEEAACLLACRLVGVRSACGQLMRGTMHIGVLVLVEIADSVDDRLRLLRRCSIVQPDQRAPVNHSRRMGKSRRIASTSKEDEERPRSPSSSECPAPGATTGTASNELMDRGWLCGSLEAGARWSGAWATVPKSCGAFRSSGVANGLLSLEETCSVLAGLSATASAGTGPGIARGEEKSGRASSMNENAGSAEESTGLNAPGIAGAGGWMFCCA